LRKSITENVFEEGCVRGGETRSYNDDNTLASISYSGAAIGDLSYTWDANQNKTSESIGGVMSGYGFTASYDAEDRLISWDRSDASLDQSWDLSPVGDWNSITQNASVQNRTHGPVHELLTASGQAVQHDPKGNMTLIPPALRPGSDPLKLKWDFNNKLKAADTDNDGVDDVFYRWDALGRRVGRDDGTTSVVYVHDGQQTISDYVAGTAASSPTYNYVYASYIDEPVVRGGSGVTRYFHRNGQYSIIALTDHLANIVERYAYTAYGQMTITNGSGTVQATSASNNRYTYTGREWDARLSLYYYRARMYDSVSGRFASRDPIGYFDYTNLYTYVLGCPLVFIDPQGLACKDNYHHWFPQKHRFRIEGKCRSINFNIDFFTTLLKRCWGDDEYCDAHGWLHGQNRKGRPKRTDWVDDVEDILDSSLTCCGFLIAMAAEIPTAYAELADEFADCGQEPCYRLKTFRPPRSPDHIQRPDTTLLWATIVAACRRGEQPSALPDESDVNRDEGGMPSIYPEWWLVPLGPKMPFPRVSPKTKPPVPHRIPREAPPIEVPRRIAA